MFKDDTFLRLFLFLLLFSVVQFACTSSSTGTEEPIVTDSLTAFEMNTLLGRGVNLGNALEAPNEGEWGLTLEANFFTEIKNAGFSSVRIPVRWSTHAAESKPFAIDLSFISRVDWAVKQAIENDLIVVINIHHYEELFQLPYDHKERFLALWRQIGSWFKNVPNNQLVFEILNEPHDNLAAELWNEFLEDALKIVRESNPDRIVIIGTAEWGGLAALNKLVIPEDENKAILTFHYYNPFHFTHQGAEWVDGSDDWLGTRWNATQNEIAVIQNEFNSVQSWAADRQIPVYLGEFGAYNKADNQSRCRWMQCIRAEAEKRSFSWAYWEFGAGFGLYDITSNQWKTDLLKALIP